MPGAGTKTATTTNSPPARCLDITRLVSRAGRTLTGIDRVERAYLEALINRKTPIFGLARSAFGYLLLDRDGLTGLLARIDGDTPWGPIDLLSRAALRLSPEHQRAEADARRLAIGRSRRGALRSLLARHLPDRTAYLNVGHSNLTARVVDAVKAIPDATIAVLLHDVIPLDHPEYQRVGTQERFAGFLRRASQSADLLICNSGDTCARARVYLEREGRVPTTAVAHLGVNPAPPDPDALPTHLPPKRPYFVTLGTIEPRKNHVFLLDLWQQTGLPYPLVFVGSRGWNNDDVFARLDAKPPHVIEVAELDDGTVSALMEGAAAVLMPSLAEGFGLPAGEAASLGVPLICNDLPVYAEYLGDYPIYANVSDSYLWRQVIEELAKTVHSPTTKRVGRQLPSWEEHFNIVLTMT